jgi:hypothetical protein
VDALKASSEGRRATAPLWQPCCSTAAAQAAGDATPVATAQVAGDATVTTPDTLGGAPSCCAGEDGDGSATVADDTTAADRAGDQAIDALFESLPLVSKLRRYE